MSVRVGASAAYPRGLVGQVGTVPRYSGRRFTEPLPLKRGRGSPFDFDDRSDPMPDLGGGTAIPRGSLRSAWAQGPGQHIVVERERSVLQQLFDKSTATSGSDAFCVKSVYRIWRLFDPHMEGHMAFPNFLSAVSCDEEAKLLVTRLLGGVLPAACELDCKERVIAWKSCFVQLVKFAQGLRPPLDEEKWSASSLSSATRPSMSDDSGMESGSDSGKSAEDEEHRKRKRHVDFEDFVKACQERQLLVMPATQVGRAAMTLEALQEQRRLSLVAHAGNGELLDSIL